MSLHPYIFFALNKSWAERMKRRLATSMASKPSRDPALREKRIHLVCPIDALRTYKALILRMVDETDTSALSVILCHR